MRGGDKGEPWFRVEQGVNGGLLRVTEVEAWRRPTH